MLPRPALAATVHYTSLVDQEVGSCAEIHEIIHNRLFLYRLLPINFRFVKLSQNCEKELVTGYFLATGGSIVP